MSAAPSSIRMAGPADDAGLRALFRETALPGSFEITMEREPSYFQSLADSRQHDVFVAVRNEVIVGCGSCVQRDTWWAGREALTAYLSDLRTHPLVQRRAGWMLRDGYRALATIHSTSPATVSWTAVFEQNGTARKALTGRSGSIPNYIDRGRLYCPILLVPRWARFPSLPGVTWHGGQVKDWDELASFLNTQLHHRPLAPVHRAADFTEGVRWPCLAASDFILARRQDRLAGVIAVWDVRPIRQVRLIRMHGWIGKFRAPVNAAARLTGWPSLPERGSILPMAYASFLAVEKEDAFLAKALLRAARALAAERGLSFLCACAHEKHPFASVLRHLPAIASHGRLYEVDLNSSRTPWPDAAPHIEPALL